MSGRARYYRGWRYIDAGGMIGYLCVWLVVGLLLLLCDWLNGGITYLQKHPAWSPDLRDPVFTFCGVLATLFFLFRYVGLRRQRDPDEAPVHSGEATSFDIVLFSAVCGAFLVIAYHLFR